MLNKQPVSGPPFKRIAAWHSGQLATLGATRQRRLSKAKVVLVGCGRIGSSFALGAHAAGIGQLVCIDGQVIEPEQLGPFVFAHSADLGRPKADVLARFLSIRHHGAIESIPKPVEATNIDEVLKGASLVVCAANQLKARLLVEQRTIAQGIPVMQAAAFDSRERLGGMITLHCTRNTALACYGCLIARTAFARSRRDSALLTTVTALVGHFAAHLAAVLLADFGSGELHHNNLFLINLQPISIEGLSVSSRTDCRICGSPPCTS